MREADLYPIVKRYFRQMHYDVYAEVPAPHGGYVDLLAVRDNITVAVELKPRFSREAVRQAGRNKRFVWASYVAVPETAQVLPRRRAALKRHRAGLLLVGGDAVSTAMEAALVAPPCTVREAFGPHLEGALARLYAEAEGGVPARERVSAFRTLVAKVRAAIRERGGIANTDQVLADTLAWNYFRGKRSGVCWVLKHYCSPVDEDLWRLRGGRDVRPKGTARFPIAARSLVKTHLANTFVCMPAPEFLPAPGDLVELRSDAGSVERQVRVIWAERHPVVETPQRELRAGPAVFFPWRCPQELKLPDETLVLRLAL